LVLKNGAFLSSGKGPCGIRGNDNRSNSSNKVEEGQRVRKSFTWGYMEGMNAETWEMGDPCSVRSYERLGIAAPS